MSTGGLTLPSSVQRGRRWQRLRWPLGIGAVVLVAALLGLLLVRPTASGALDPANPAPQGARALANVLQGQGIDVRIRTRFSDVQADLGERPGAATVLVARPERIGGTRASDLAALTARARADLVVIGAGNEVVADLDLPVGAAPAPAPTAVSPDCGLPTPGRAGSVVVGGTGYTPLSLGSGPDLGSTPCYPLATGEARPAYGLVELAYGDGRRTTLVGSGAALSNDRLADAGDAALAVGLLGRRAVLVWWTPDPLDGADGVNAPSLLDLLPDGVRLAAVQLLVVLGVVVLWRGRRFGRLVPERLPVVVRAVETTHGRAQLYRKARARGRAAQVLRAATVRRLASRLGLAARAPVPEVVSAVAAAIGRPAVEVAALLVGPDPDDDASLVTLARSLHDLETEVQQS